VIVRFDGKDNPTWEDIGMKEIASAGRKLDVSVKRAGKTIDTSVTPVLDDRSGVGSAGWSPQAEVEIGNVLEGPAQKAGLKKGDLLLTAGGLPIHSAYTLQDVVKNSNGKPVIIEFERNGQHQTLTLQPEMSKRAGSPQWMIGVELERHLNLITTRLSFPEALRESLDENIKGATLIFKFLRGIIERRMSPKSLEGPIRIAQLSGEAARQGPSAFFMLMSMVSLNLAIFNLLPIPILDGGVIVLLMVEMLMRRDLSLQIKETVFKVGFVFLMVVVAFVIYNDLSKILPTG
jgi:regulator of sigma E protease